MNGWQRLWVLTIGLWALVVASVAWGLWTFSTAGSVSFATQVLAWWIIPALAVYALGWAVGWVRRGFHL